MSNEGVIKFNYYCENDKDIIPDNVFDIINPARDKLAEIGYIGQYPDGLGYGNISIRCDNSDSFYISASDTGKFKKAQKEHYVKIISCNIDENICQYSGLGLPSSETLTHHIIYQFSKETKAIIHIHNKHLWESLIARKLPSTSKNAEYGTVEMVNEVAELFKRGKLKGQLLVLEGHEDGVISFGSGFSEAMSVLSIS